MRVGSRSAAPADTPTRSDKKLMFSLIVVITAAAAVSNEALLGGGGIFKFGKAFNMVNYRARVRADTLTGSSSSTSCFAGWSGEWVLPRILDTKTGESQSSKGYEMIAMPLNYRPGHNRVKPLLVYMGQGIY